jgi:RNA polymerase sigma factor (sigma-70 family)
MTEMASANTVECWNDDLANELLRFLTRRLHCAETAAEITQETYLRFHQCVLDNPPNNARALAYRIALNLSVDYQRKANVRRSREVETDFEAHSDFFPSTAAGPEQTAIARQELNTLESALLELPPDCRTAFLWHSLDGLTYLEIAKRLGVSESMVNKHLMRAMAHCKRRVQRPKH